MLTPDQAGGNNEAKVNTDTESGSGWHMGVQFEKEAADAAAQATVEGTQVTGEEPQTCDCGLPLDQCVENGGPGLADEDAVDFGQIFSGLFRRPSQEELQAMRRQELLQAREGATAQIGSILDRLTTAAVVHQQMVQELFDDFDDVLGSED